MFYSYFIHILFHKIPHKYNLHLKYHHNSEQNSTKIGKIVSFIIEFLLVDVGVFFLLYLLQKLVNYELFPPILILYYGIIYVTVHNINYSILHIGNHTKHHFGQRGNASLNLFEGDNELLTTNYGPDTIDHLLGTNHDNVVENMFHNIPNILFAFLISLYFIR